MAGLAAETPEDLYDDADFSSAAIQACYVDGKRVAAPLAVETVTLFYNTDKVTEVPETWEELVEMAGDVGGVQFDSTSIYYDLGFLRACGGYIFKYENGAYDVTDIGLANDGAVQAYEFINSLYVDYGYVSSDVTRILPAATSRTARQHFLSADRGISMDSSLPGHRLRWRRCLLSMETRL